VVAFDVRGQGESEADPNHDYSQETLANDLLAGMDALNIPKAVLIGWSVGALTATRFAANHPDRTLAVVLVDNAPAGDKIGVDPRPMQEYIKLLEDDFYGKGIEVYVNRWFPEEGPEIEELKRWAQAVCRRIGRDPVLGIRVAGVPPDRLDLLARLAVPTLIMQGGASPGSGRPMGEYLKSIVSDSRLYVFEGKGHAFNLTAPDEFNQVLESFLAELRSSYPV
jgi:pimeloyl-ACP methyl ester carboxylesterase